MEGNRDESQKCLELGVKYMNAGHYEKALKFLTKADKLYPSPQTKILLSKLEQQKKTSGSTNSPEMRRRNVGADKPAAPKLGVDYTAEQMEVVTQVNKCKDFYQILGVTKDSTDSAIKKAYKKLALQLHPDKNKAPGAIDAFKALSNANTTLTDVQKRKEYDLKRQSEEQKTNARFNQNTSNWHSNQEQTYSNYNWTTYNEYFEQENSGYNRAKNNEYSKKQENAHCYWNTSNGHFKEQENWNTRSGFWHEHNQHNYRYDKQQSEQNVQGRKWKWSNITLFRSWRLIVFLGISTVLERELFGNITLLTPWRLAVFMGTSVTLQEMMLVEYVTVMRWRNLFNVLGTSAVLERMITGNVTLFRPWRLFVFMTTSVVLGQTITKNDTILTPRHICGLLCTSMALERMMTGNFPRFWPWHFVLFLGTSWMQDARVVQSSKLWKLPHLIVLLGTSMALENIVIANRPWRAIFLMGTSLVLEQIANLFNTKPSNRW